MDIPAQNPFFAMFEMYHSQVQFFPYLGFGLGFAVIALFFGSYHQRSRISLLILAFLWAWNGLVLFTYEAAGLSPVLYSLQGLLFPIQALLLIHAACAKKPPDFGIGYGLSGKAGLALMFTAIFIYPIVGNITGHTFPAAPVFPEPCPLTIFTFGYLLSTRTLIRPVLIFIPFLWSLTGMIAVLKLGVMADSIELITGISCTVAILLKNRKIANTARPA
ncbi:DUF6064 family protein [Dethiosulfatarculus sandiegensis]|uniref:Uncharacterized protein n=1 Tax=Dethiosulfatarculus sandiegensis TaxID=1429043 RepID=A0A0D2HZL5_9BACT|nr:DUF6064 family protein [Dethiosulfatarculus sandiegensis]KIX15723.1 hypothetical protein X474_02750 [Dethiosulfatarculus sandiegensis]